MIDFCISMGIMFTYLFQSEIPLDFINYMTIISQYLCIVLRSISHFAVMLKLIMNDKVQYFFYFLHFFYSAIIYSIFKDAQHYLAQN